MTQSEARIKRAIGKAIDENRELPDWIVSELASDETYGKFHDRSIELASRLSREAKQWLRESELGQNQLQNPAQRESSGNPGRYSGDPSAFERVDAAMDHDNAGTMTRVNSNSSRKRARLFTAMILATGASVLWMAFLPINMPYWSLSIRGHNTSGEQNASTVPAPPIDSIAEDPSIQSDDSLLSQAPAADLSEVVDGTAWQSVENPQLIFLAFDSTLNAIELINSTVAHKVMGDPLERMVVEQAKLNWEDGRSENPLAATESVSVETLELLRELKRTSDFLAQSFPRRTLRSSVGSEGH